MKNVKKIPNFSNYGITPKGELYNLLTGKKLKTSPCVRGYHGTILVNDDGERKSVKRHRLVALTHLHHPNGDINDYVVNHLDGIPGNDSACNLEWVTQKDNVVHWVESGGIRKKIPLEIMHVDSGKVVQYESISACSNDINLDRYCIVKRLVDGPEYVWPEGIRYREGHSDNPWPEIKPLKYGNSREVIVLDLDAKKIRVYEKLTDLKKTINACMASLWKWASDPQQPLVADRYLIQFLDSFNKWRIVSDKLDEIDKSSVAKVVVVFNSDKTKYTWYSSAIECAGALNIKPTALNYRLQSKGNTVFKDGKRYVYYSDLNDSDKKKIRYEVPQL